MVDRGIQHRLRSTKRRVKVNKACYVLKYVCRENSTRNYPQSRSYGRQLSGSTLLPVCSRMREKWVRLAGVTTTLGRQNTTMASTE